MNLLHVDSSILGDASASRLLSAQIVERLRRERPSAEVTYLDLSANPLPHYSMSSITGSDAVEAARNAALLEAFLAADTVVIGVPLYNFAVPSQLKAWIDRIAIKGRTFRYTANGPEGLVKDKRVIVAIARGGIYAPGAGTEFAESYLKHFFGFLGVQDLTFVRAEGLNVSETHRAASLAAAQDVVATLEAPPQDTALAA